MTPKRPRDSNEAASSQAAAELLDDLAKVCRVLGYDLPRFL